MAVIALLIGGLLGSLAAVIGLLLGLGWKQAALLYFGVALGLSAGLGLLIGWQGTRRPAMHDAIQGAEQGARQLARQDA